jgi:hypothetical protein
MDVLDRIPELGDRLVEALAYLMDLDDDEELTVSDVLVRVPELGALFEKADFFLEELDKDHAIVAVEFWCGELDETDEYVAAGWIETVTGSVLVGFPWDAADDE